MVRHGSRHRHRSYRIDRGERSQSPYRPQPAAAHTQRSCKLRELNGDRIYLKVRAYECEHAHARLKQHTRTNCVILLSCARIACTQTSPRHGAAVPGSGSGSETTSAHGAAGPRPAWRAHARRGHDAAHAAIALPFLRQLAGRREAGRKREPPLSVGRVGHASGASALRVCV